MGLSALAKLRKLLLKQGVDAPSEAQFARKYMQSKDIRTQPEQYDEVLQSIMENGWRQGFGPNLLPPYRGGAPSSIIDRAYAPRAGEQVFLTPSEWIDSGKAGSRIKEGWVPKEYEVIRPETDYPDLYEEFLRAMQRHYGR